MIRLNVFLVLVFLLLITSVSFGKKYPPEKEGEQTITPAVAVTSDEQKITDAKTKKELTDLLIANAINANVLAGQIKSLGLTPVVTVPVFPENLTRLKSKEIRSLASNYNKLAIELQKQLSQTPVSTIEKLKELLDSTQKSISNLTYQNELEKLKLYNEQRSELEEYFEMLKEENLNNLFKNSKQVINASVLARQFFLDPNVVSSDFSLGAKVELSLFPMFNAADFFEFYGEFVKPNIYVKDVYDNEHAWNINHFSTGFNIRYPGKIDMNYFLIGMRFGAGYYWTLAKEYNTGADESFWKGYVINFEVDMMKYTWFYPLDVYVQYSLFYPRRDFAFTTNDLNTFPAPVNLGKGMFSGLSVGLRLCLWWEDKY